MRENNIEKLDELISLMRKNKTSENEIINFLENLQPYLKSYLNSKFKKAFSFNEIMSLKKIAKDIGMNGYEKARFIELGYEDKTGITVKSEIENFYQKVINNFAQKEIDSSTKIPQVLESIIGR